MERLIQIAINMVAASPAAENMCRCFQYEESVVEDKPQFHMETSVEDDRHGGVNESAESARVQKH
jgi:hypothetical protein